MKEYHEIKDALCYKLKEYGEKGKNINADDVMMIKTLSSGIDKMNHIIDREEEEEGYSERGNSYRFYNVRPNNRNSYNDGGSNSYGRERDEMGRYSENRYSRNDRRMPEYMDEWNSMMDRYR
jgi:hypothetical protein